MVARIDNWKIRKVVRKTCIERRKISLLKDEIMRQFDEKLSELIDVGVCCVWTFYGWSVWKDR